MSWTVTDIQTAIANEADKSSTPPTTGDGEWTIRLNLINRALRDWAESYDWDTLKKIHNGAISTATANASYSLPSDFRRLDSYVRIVGDGRSAFDYPADNVTENIKYNDTDKFVNILGNPASGYVMYINGGTLVSGASVQFSYYAFPATLATTTQVAEVPDPTFLVQRTLYYLYKVAEDARFPEAKQESDRILARMIENENVKGWGNSERSVKVFKHPYRNWRVGNNG